MLDASGMVNMQTNQQAYRQYRSMTNSFHGEELSSSIVNNMILHCPVKEKPPTNQACVDRVKNRYTIFLQNQNLPTQFSE